MSHRVSNGLFFALTLVAVGCAGNASGGDESIETASAPLSEDTATAESTATASITAESAALPAEAAAVLQQRGTLDAAKLDKLYTIEHYIPIGTGRRIHVTERFNLRAWLRWPHRAVVMLPGTVSKGSFYNLDVDGYRFQDEVASRGIFSFTVDYEGSGSSTYPANGLDVTHAYLVQAMRPVIAYARAIRLVPRVDVFGESNGGAIAAELCADASRIRSCTLSSMLYREGTPFFNAVFLDPGFQAFLLSHPNGYIEAGPELFFNITSRTSPEVTAAILATQTGRYSVAPLVAANLLPWFDPTRASVPALILEGTEDNIATQNDANLLAADYGSASSAHPTATVVRIAGGGHIPRIEPAPVSVPWRQAVMNFLDPQ